MEIAVSYEIFVLPVVLQTLIISGLVIFYVSGHLQFQTTFFWLKGDYVYLQETLIFWQKKDWLYVRKPPEKWFPQETKQIISDIL